MAASSSLVSPPKLVNAQAPRNRMQAAMTWTTREAMLYVRARGERLWMSAAVRKNSARERAVKNPAKAKAMSSSESTDKAQGHSPKIMRRANSTTLTYNCARKSMSGRGSGSLETARDAEAAARGAECGIKFLHPEYSGKRGERQALGMAVHRARTNTAGVALHEARTSTSRVGGPPAFFLPSGEKLPRVRLFLGEKRPPTQAEETER